MVAVSGPPSVVLFRPVKLGILPVPAAARPISGLLLVQLYTIVPPVVGLVKFTAAVGEPLHTVWLATTSTVAVGFTVMVKVIGVPVQVMPLVYTGVTVIVATAGAVPVLMPLNEAILPVPEAPKPIEVLLLV